MLSRFNYGLLYKIYYLNNGPNNDFKLNNVKVRSGSPKTKSIYSALHRNFCRRLVGGESNPDILKHGQWWVPFASRDIK